MTMAVSTHQHVDPQDSSLAGARAWFSQKGLSRPRDGRLLAGVSAGVARRYDLNPLVARLLAFAGAVVLTPLVYVAAWILMPNDADTAPAAASAA
jgi:phage shock protein PspC (stress-responsive transcriptional regulator)